MRTMKQKIEARIAELEKRTAWPYRNRDQEEITFLKSLLDDLESEADHNKELQ